MRCGFIAAEKATYPVRVLCRMLEVSRAGFYARQTRPPAARTQQDQRLGVEIQAIHAETRQRYGSPRVHAELREHGHRVGLKRAARLMRQHGLCARRRRRFRITTDSTPSPGGGAQHPGWFLCAELWAESHRGLPRISAIGETFVPQRETVCRTTEPIEEIP